MGNFAGMRNEILKDILIHDIAEAGKSAGRHDNQIIFVEKAVPGDVVNVMVTRKKKNYLEGKIHEIKVSSPLRTDPFCSHFGVCGGCTWQHLTYQAQLEFKQKQVEDAMKRIGKIHDARMLPILPSQHTRYYRNKLEYTFSDTQWQTKEEHENNAEQEPALGFHIPRRFDKVLDIKNCYLQPEPTNAIRLEVKCFAIKNNLSFFNLRSQTGFLRNLIVRNTTLNEWMVAVIFSYDDYEKSKFLLQHISEKFPGITSLMYAVNSKRNDSIYDLQFQLYNGVPYITEQMEELRFRTGPKSFFQTNSHQALELYKKVREFAALKGNETAYDLYSGTGTIANFLASGVKRITGFEYVKEAVEDAKANAALNNITNAEFFAGDIKDLLNDDFAERHGNPDVIITDPPRAGMHEEITNRLLSSGAKKIIYISCNPATQARDINLLVADYDLVKYQPVDMFPHTQHIENVALLELRMR